jgi:hypothetical protein
LSFLACGPCGFIVTSHKCVFGDVSPSLARALLLAGEEMHIWSLARARGISYLIALCRCSVICFGLLCVR